MILSSKIWELPPEKPFFSKPRKLGFQQGAAASCGELAVRRKVGVSKVLKAGPRAEIPSWKLGK